MNSNTEIDATLLNLLSEYHRLQTTSSSYFIADLEK